MDLKKQYPPGPYRMFYSGSNPMWNPLCVGVRWKTIRSFQAGEIGGIRITYESKKGEKKRIYLQVFLSSVEEVMASPDGPIHNDDGTVEIGKYVVVEGLPYVADWELNN